MLYCSEDRLIPTNINLMTIQSDDGMYYYVHRSLYDQAVILSDRFKGKEDELRDIIGRYNSADVPECVEYFHLVVPEPLNILGYFLALIDGFEEMSQDIEILCGVIHQMSAAINFRTLISFPKEMRAQAKFSLSIETEFRLSWDRFFQESLPYNEDVLLGRTQVTTSSMSPSSMYVSEPDENGTVMYEEEDDGEEFDWDSFVDNIGNEEEEKKEPVIQKEVIEEEEPEENEEDNGADLISSLT